MKRNFFRRMTSFIAMTLVCTAVFAQNTQEVKSSSLTSLGKLIVRASTNGDEVISGRTHVGSNGNMASEFVKFGQTLSNSRQVIISNSVIDDFCVFDGMVYFCGAANSQKVFGYFKESEFNSSSFNATVFKLANVDFVNRIKVYRDDATQNVNVAIVGGRYDTSCVGYIISPSTLIVGKTNGVNFNYFQYEFSIFNPCYYNYYIQFQDIVITNDYIVAVGYETETSRDIILSRIKKSNLASLEYLTITDPSHVALNSTIVMENLKTNDVAFSSLFSDASTGNSFMRVYVFDMDNLTNMNIQDIKLTDKVFPDDMLFLPYDGTLMLLLTAGGFPSTQDVSSMVYYLDPYATQPYTVDFMYDANNRWYSFDRLTSSYFVVGGRTPQYERYYLIRDKQAGTTSSCVHYSPTGVTMQPILSGNISTITGLPSNVVGQSLQCVSNYISLYDGCRD